MNPTEFKAIVVNTIEPQLTALGYKTDIQPPRISEDGFVQFKKRLTGDICIIIEFQPKNPETADFFHFTVNLVRNSAHCDNYVKTPEYLRYQIYQRLAPYLWINSAEEPQYRDDWGSFPSMGDYWWHFLNAEELQSACLDALDKLFKFGIPYLEDLNSKPLEI
jgi:hypothetical protein